MGMIDIELESYRIEVVSHIWYTWLNDAKGTYAAPIYWELFR